MPEPTYSQSDLELFIDLDAAARSIGGEPCMIGAGALQLGPDLDWGVRLTRRTRDWDFAVRAASWKEFNELRARLTERNAGFSQDREAHRFRHRAGGTLDLVPYGALESPPGQVQWADRTAMETLGLEALDHHHCSVKLGHVKLRTASLPALVGLKILAYHFRRPRITRDIADVHAILRQVDAHDVSARIDLRASELLEFDRVHFNLLGSYFLGREVGCAFKAEPLAAMTAVLDASELKREILVADILRAQDEFGSERATVESRLAALLLGMARA